MAGIRVIRKYFYNYHIDNVFDAVMRTGQVLNLSVTFANHAAYRVEFSKGPSLTSWGERIVIVMGILPEDGRTGLCIVSTSSLGTEIGGRGRNERNVNEFISALNQFLPK